MIFKGGVLIRFNKSFGFFFFFAVKNQFNDDGEESTSY